MRTQSWIYFWMEWIPKEKENDIDYSLVYQFTWLLDKNWKEVYEGDILSKLTGWEHSVWVDEKWEWIMVPTYTFFYIKWEEGIQSEDYYPPIFISWLSVPEKPEEWEIVGNIYENPTLWKPTL